MPVCKCVKCCWIVLDNDSLQVNQREVQLLLANATDVDAVSLPRLHLHQTIHLLNCMLAAGLHAVSKLSVTASMPDPSSSVSSKPHCASHTGHRSTAQLHSLSSQSEQQQQQQQQQHSKQCEQQQWQQQWRSHQSEQCMRQESQQERHSQQSGECIGQASSASELPLHSGEAAKWQSLSSLPLATLAQR